MRKSDVIRNTNETKIQGCLDLDGYMTDKEVPGNINTGIGFLNHMLVLLEKHGGFNLDLVCHGDLDVDCHHTVEDIGIVLGSMIKEALGDKKGIRRYASVTIPMDEVLTTVTIDLSGRPFLVFNADIANEQIGEYDTEITEDFFRAVSFQCGMNLHINVHYGKNSHHIIESMFKAFARALKEAAMVDPTVKGVMSTKGCL
ncbi:MAG: imidazoleglycerol-phosphate dehydratase HisB [Clostridia bacterium]|nr:imidazoleglycerol-phosphate dehydratase HisB [Clostridia bacterium]MBR3838433.1 imidazoleglycerol-phosphate dehydratase HisB [Clostridia bacterium]